MTLNNEVPESKFEKSNFIYKFQDKSDSSLKPYDLST